MRNSIRTSTATSAAAGAAGSRLPGNLLRVGAALLGVGMASVLMIDGSRAAFSDTTANEDNTVAAGTVVLNDDDAGNAMFDVSGLNGGQSVQRCINVAYAGSLTADVKMYANVQGELANGLNTTVDIGTGATGGSSFSCTNFSPTSTVHNDSLGKFGNDHASYATGVGGFDDAVDSTTRSYRITMTVSNDSQYQGTSAAVDFTWEAQGQDA